MMTLDEMFGEGIEHSHFLTIYILKKVNDNIFSPIIYSNKQSKRSFLCNMNKFLKYYY